MKIAITTVEPQLDAAVDPRFGRCPFFLIVETDDMSFTPVENANQALGQGAGIQSAKLVADQGVKFVLTGNCGPNAHQTLSAAGISVILGCAGTARAVVEQFIAGGMQAAQGPNVPGHAGMNATADSTIPASNPQQQTMNPGQGNMGMGMGRGRGMGMGRGRGRGMGMGLGFGRGRGCGMGRGRGGMEQGGGMGGRWRGGAS